MTRYFHPNPRDTVEQTRSLSIQSFVKNGSLSKNTLKSSKITWSRHGKEIANINALINTLGDNSYVMLYFKSRWKGESDWTDIKQTFQLTNTPCKFGGKKWFFLCSFNNCNKRVRSLYTNGLYFSCRHCARLSYDSCNKTNAYRYGYFKILGKHWDAQEYLSTLKRTTYKGKATRKYKKYLKMNWMSEHEVDKAEMEMDRLLTIVKK
jgi:hypothetical protein